MNKRGISGFLDNPENENKLKALIVKYDKEENLQGKITYQEICDYIKLCKSKGEISFSPGITWWKTVGKSLIEEYNLVKKKKLYFSEKKQLDVIDIDDFLKKFKVTDKALKNGLKEIDIVVNRMIERIKKLENKIVSYEKSLLEKNKKISKQEEIIKKQQSLIDNLFYLHATNEYQLKHILNSNDEKSEVIRYSMEKTFSDPKLYIESFINRCIIKDTDNNNVIELNRKKEDDEFEF